MSVEFRNKIAAAVEGRKQAEALWALVEDKFVRAAHAGQKVTASSPVVVNGSTLPDTRAAFAIIAKEHRVLFHFTDNATEAYMDSVVPSQRLPDLRFTSLGVAPPGDFMAIWKWLCKVLDDAPVQVQREQRSQWMLHCITLSQLCFIVTHFEEFTAEDFIKALTATGLLNGTPVLESPGLIHAVVNRNWKPIYTITKCRDYVPAWNEWSETEEGKAFLVTREAEFRVSN